MLLEADSTLVKTSLCTCHLLHKNIVIAYFWFPYASSYNSRMECAIAERLYHCVEHDLQILLVQLTQFEFFTK